VANFVKVAKSGEIANRRGKVVNVGGKNIAVLNADGKFYAVDNTCPHRNGPLGEGETYGTKVVCPWHGYEYDLVTGECTDFPEVKIGCYPVKLEGDDILIEV
jgi:nitrite reductase/ring-hydroxylating ferredoxin subunit